MRKCSSRQKGHHVDAQSPHPEEILRTLCLEPLGLSVTEAAKALRVSRGRRSEKLWLRISSRKVAQNIAKLKALTLLKRIGPAKGGYWQVTEDQREGM